MEALTLEAVISISSSCKPCSRRLLNSKASTPIGSNSVPVDLDAYSKFNNRYYYCDIKPGSWEGITETACVPTFEAEYNDGRMFSTPSIAQSNDDLKAYGGFMRWWEYSGLGAQFVINWEYY